MLKKALFIFLIIIITTACTKKTTTNNQPVELTYWGLYEPEENLKPIFDEYTKNHPNIKITYVRKSFKEYKEQVISRAGQSNGPDIFRYHNSWIPMFNPYLASTPSDVTSQLNFSKNVYPAVEKDLQLKTGYSGVPLMYDGLGLYYNKQIFRARGLDKPPQYWDDLIKVAKDLTVKSSNGIDVAGLAMGSTNVDHWQDIISLLMYQNNVNPAFVTEDNISKLQGAVDFFASPVKTDQIWDSTWSNSTDQFAQGKVAMYFGTSWRAFEIQAQNPNLEFAIAPIPQLPGSQISLASYYLEGVSNRISEVKQTESWNLLVYLSKATTQEKLFSQQSATRLFGEPPANPSLYDKLSNNQYVSGILSTAPSAKTSYLVDKTYSTGITQQFSDLYQSYLQNNNQKEFLAGLKKIQAQYNLSNLN